MITATLPRTHSRRTGLQRTVRAQLASLTQLGETNPHRARTMLLELLRELQNHNKQYALFEALRHISPCCRLLHFSLWDTDQLFELTRYLTGATSILIGSCQAMSDTQLEWEKTVLHWPAGPIDPRFEDELADVRSRCSMLLGTE